MRHLRGVPLVDWAATSISVAIDKQAIGKSSFQYRKQHREPKEVKMTERL